MGKEANEELDIKQLLQEQIRANRELAAALLESRKPYEDPKVLAQRDKDRAELRAAIEKTRREKEALKRICSHLRANNSLNIGWMEHANGEITGVCGTCLSQFNATQNTDDRALFRSDQRCVDTMARARKH